MKNGFVRLALNHFSSDSATGYPNNEYELSQNSFWFAESSFASYPGSLSWLQEAQQQSKDEVFEANNENVVRLESRRRSANNNNRKCC